MRMSAGRSSRGAREGMRMGAAGAGRAADRVRVAALRISGAGPEHREFRTAGGPGEDTDNPRADGAARTAAKIHLAAELQGAAAVP